jgi:hypothetical protein
VEASKSDLAYILLILRFNNWMFSFGRANQFAHGQMGNYSKYLLGDKRFERAISKMGQMVTFCPSGFIIIKLNRPNPLLK